MNILDLNKTYNNELTDCIKSGKLKPFYNHYEDKMNDIIFFLYFVNNDLINLLPFFQLLWVYIDLLSVYIDLHNKYSFVIRMVRILKFH